jgi:hypothetical protein
VEPTVSKSPRATQSKLVASPARTAPPASTPEPTEDARAGVGGSGKKAGMIAGIVIAVVAMLAALIALLCWWKSRQGESEEEEKIFHGVQIFRTPGQDLHDDDDVSFTTQENPLFRDPDSDVPPDAIDIYEDFDEDIVF